MNLTKKAQKQMKLAITAQENPEHRFTNLYSLMHWDHWIRCAADAVLARPGSSTAGVDGRTRDAFKTTILALCHRELAGTAHSVDNGMRKQTIVSEVSHAQAHYMPFQHFASIP